MINEELQKIMEKKLNYNIVKEFEKELKKQTNLLTVDDWKTIFTYAESKSQANTEIFKIALKNFIGSKKANLKKFSSEIPNAISEIINNRYGKTKRTLLSLAIEIYTQKNDLEAVVKYLVDKGANPNIQNIAGWTALHYAAFMGQPRVVKYLIDNGADVNIKNNIGLTAAQITKNNGLLKGQKKEANVNIGNKYGVPTYNGTLTGPPRLISPRLISQRLKSPRLKIPILIFKDSNNFSGITLHIAASMGNLGLVRDLVEQGADINKKDEFGHTALYSAADGGHLDVVDYLLHKGADINSMDDIGSTILHQMALMGNLRVVKYLVEHGADITIQTKAGETALQIAERIGSLGVEGGHKDVVKYLKGKQAEKNKSTSSKGNIAREEGNESKKNSRRKL